MSATTTTTTTDLARHPDGAPPTVVLLHGLARTRGSLTRLRRHLERAGFPTWARTYPSRHMSIASAADLVASWIARDLPSSRPLVAITHSLGGILIRHIGARVPFSRVVMLSPPNRGSRVSRAFHDNPIYRWFFGPVGQEMAAPAADIEQMWPPPTAPCAVIAGTRGRFLSNPTIWLARRRRCFAAGEPNDGTLAVEETRLPQMAAFATVDASHTWIMNDARARAMAVAFLRDGSLTG